MRRFLPRKITVGSQFKRPRNTYFMQRSFTREVSHHRLIPTHDLNLARRFEALLLMLLIPNNVNSVGENKNELSPRLERFGSVVLLQIKSCLVLNTFANYEWIEKISNRRFVMTVGKLWHCLACLTKHVERVGSKVRMCFCKYLCSVRERYIKFVFPLNYISYCIYSITP